MEQRCPEDGFPACFRLLMQHALLLEQVRESVKRAFAAHGLTSFADFSEAILIRNGYYCGRSFTCGGLRAVWFAEENRLKLFGRNNELLLSQPATDSDEQRQAFMAA
jgi:hypothetical protein